MQPNPSRRSGTRRFQHGGPEAGSLQPLDQGLQRGFGHEKQANMQQSARTIAAFDLPGPEQLRRAERRKTSHFVFQYALRRPFRCERKGDRRSSKAEAGSRSTIAPWPRLCRECALEGGSSGRVQVKAAKYRLAPAAAADELHTPRIALAWDIRLHNEGIGERIILRQAFRDQSAHLVRPPDQELLEHDGDLYPR